MAKRAAIRMEGDAAERLFMANVPNSEKSNSAVNGDVMVRINDTVHYIEVKECHAEKDKGGTINQVRAIKYITCAIWAPKHELWYVVSPARLVQMASKKARGQHTEIPFECMNFNLKSLVNDSCVKCRSSDLEETVHKAIKEGEGAPDLKELMKSLADEITELKLRYIKAVREIDES